MGIQQGGRTWVYWRESTYLGLISSPPSFPSPGLSQIPLAFPLGVFLISALPPITLSHLCPPFPTIGFVSLPKHLGKPQPAVPAEPPALASRVLPSCCPGAGGWGAGCADVRGRLSAPPRLTQISSSVLSESIYFYCLSCSKAIFQEQKGQHVQD